MPGLLGGAVSSLGSLFTLANGIGNLIKGHKMHPVRPEYEIPDEIGQQLALRQNLLNAEMPGQQQAEIVTEQELPTWLNEKARFNKGLDPVKLNDLYPKYFNDQRTQKTSEPVKPQTPLQRTVKTVKDTVRNLFGTGSTVKDVPANKKPVKKHKEDPFG